MFLLPNGLRVDDSSIIGYKRDNDLTDVLIYLPYTNVSICLPDSDTVEAMLLELDVITDKSLTVFDKVSQIYLIEFIYHDANGRASLD
jgi:hypothetical protein